MESSEQTAFIEQKEICPKDRALIAHEAAHALTSHLLGLGVQFIELDNNSGRMVFKTLTNATNHTQAVAYAAGFAGELLTMGEQYLRDSGFKGFRTDSIWLNRLGFTGNDEKSNLVQDALSLLNQNIEPYLKLQEHLEHHYVSRLPGVPVHIDGNQLPLPMVN